MKKLTSILLALLMALTLLPTAVFATETVKEWTATDSLPEYGTYKLMSDVTLSAARAKVGNGQRLTLDLNGHTITATQKAAFQVLNGTLTLTNSQSSKGGGIVASANDTAAIVVFGDYSSGHTSPVNSALTIGSDVSISSTNCSCVWIVGKGATADISGKLTANGDYAAIQGNGSIGNNVNYSETEITINDGAEITSQSNCAIYHPQKGTLTVNGGTISGGTGIEMRAGTLNVKGGTIKATGNYTTPVANDNGSTTTKGSAIVVAEHTTNLGVTVNVTGGNIVAADGAKAVVVADPQNVNADNVKVTLNGANVTGEIFKETNVSAETNPIAVSGGAYTDLASAIKYATNGATIKLASDVTLTEMVTLNKDLTINLNGHKLSRDDGNDIVQVIDDKTLTIDGTTANSEVYGRINVGIAKNIDGNVILNGGTYSCGNGKNDAGQTVLHINGTCKNSNVTIKNATITSPNDNAIQLNGGGTFLIENSTITGATAVYVKSGNLTVKGSTLTGNKSPVDYTYNGNGANATGDGMVIDSCDYPAGAPIVTIENTEVTGTKAAVGTYEILKADKAASHTKATVSLKSGTFTSDKDYPSVSTKVTGDGITASNITITGGTFTVNPNAYVSNDSYAVTYNGTTYTVVEKKAADDADKTGDKTSAVEFETAGSAGGTVIPAGLADPDKELVVNGSDGSSVVLTHGVAALLQNGGTVPEAVATKVDDVENKTAYNEAIKGKNSSSILVSTIELTGADGQKLFTTAVNGEYILLIDAIKYDKNLDSNKVSVSYLGSDGKAYELKSVATKDALSAAVLGTGDDGYFYYDKDSGKVSLKLAHLSQYVTATDKTSIPYRPRPVGTGTTTTTTTTGKAQSPTTFDAGIAIYGVMAVSSVLGMGYMGKKKFF